MYEDEFLIEKRRQLYSLRAQQEENSPLNALLPKRRTSASDITNLCCGTGIVRAIRRSNTAFSLESVETLDQTPIKLHCLGDSMPEFSVQGGIWVPANIVRFAGGVFEFENGACSGDIQIGKGGDVRNPGIGFIDFKRAGVDFVHTETAVEICEGSDARTDPGCCLRVKGGLICTVMAVVDRDLIFML